MKAITRRLRHLEDRFRPARLVACAESRAIAMLEAELNRLAERLAQDPDWPPAPPPTIEEVEKEINELFASRSERAGR